MTECRLGTWGQSLLAVYAKTTWRLETILFFAYSYSSEIWTTLTRTLFHSHFSTDWRAVVSCISNSPLNKIHTFLIRYSLQIAVHSIWGECNRRRHVENQTSAQRLTAWIDKQIRNKLSALRSMKDQRYNLGLQAWFASRH